MTKFGLSISIFFLFATHLTYADERKSFVSVPITINEGGDLILPVTLHSMKSKNTTRIFHFLFDTGASCCILDKSVPAEYFWEEPNPDVKVHDVTNQTISASMVLLKRVEIGDVIRDGILATREDLRNQLGRFQDQPVDGILGMSFLNGTRFILDPVTGCLTWWGYHIKQGITVPISHVLGIPGIGIRYGKQEARVNLDTGSASGLDLPGAPPPTAESQTGASTYIGLSGAKQLTASKTVLSRVEVGTAAWANLPVDFEPEGDTGRIGTDLLFAAPTCFDFITDQLSFSIDTEGSLLRRGARKQDLPLMWDRDCNTPRLVVFLVKPGSQMDKAGCKEGDELIRVGNLQGETLTRRSVRDLVASGTKHIWIVRRNGNQVSLNFGNE